MAKFDELRANFEQDEYYDFEGWENDNLSDLECKVCDKHKVWIEPSVQGGQGCIWIYSSEDDSTIVEGYDYQTFVQEVCSIALASNTDEEFVDGFDKYMERLIES